MPCSSWFCSIAAATTRVTQVVDDINQPAAPAQGSDLQICPISVGGDPQIASASAGVRFGAPLQNPLNPFGARLQTVWREIDLSLSRTNPYDFNLNVEAMWWAPFQSTAMAPKTEFDIESRPFYATKDGKGTAVRDVFA